MADRLVEAAEGAIGSRLAEALETLRAIRNGEVDALVVSEDAPEPQIFTLSSADRPYRMFVEAMRDGAATVSAEGLVLYANARLAEMLGTTVPLIVGKAIASFVPAAHHQALRAHDGRLESSAQIEIEIGGERSEPIWTRVAASALNVDGEHMVCYTFADLTATRCHEAALALARDQAMEALRLRSRFVANMSHEIRTPLNGVIGMTSLMLGTPLSEEQREYADGVRASANALMSVVDQILDFSKLDNGHLQLEYASFAPLTVLEEACSVVAANASAKGVELLSAVDQTVPTWVTGDSTRLRQVLTNLMMNAIKFTDSGHVCTTLTAQPDGARWRLHFRVVDTGIGVSAEASTRIFDSFSQADGSTTRNYGGTGLGLAICKQLVELMDGEIGVESVEGRGSCFWFTVVLGAATPVSHPDPPLAALDAHVLVVDDHAVSAGLLQDLLRGWGLTSVATSSGAEALQQLGAAELAGRGFDLALIDCDMPGMSGIELAQALNTRPPAAGPLPIVLLMTNQRERDAARQAGVEWFVSKPVRQAKLYDTFVQILEVTRAPEPPVLRAAPAAADPTLGAPGPLSPPIADATVLVTGERADVNRERVLLVEDNQINQRVGARMLEKRGYLVDVAPNGQAAIDMHRRSPYRAIFLDCQMPVLDGYQAAAEIRRREHDDEHVPIIAMTANIIKGDREKCLAAGMDDYLGKPFTGESLDEVIARTLAVDIATIRSAGLLDTDPAPLLDATALDELCLGDEKIRHDLIALFVQQSCRSVAQIGDALTADDAGALFGHAHHLKGSSASVGALRMAEVSERLCLRGRTGVLAGANELFAELRAVTSETFSLLCDASQDASKAS